MNIQPKTYIRLGNVNSSTTRPLKVVIPSTLDKEKVLPSTLDKEKVIYLVHWIKKRLYA